MRLLSKEFENFDLFTEYALKYYTVTYRVSKKDFLDDLNRLVYIKAMLTKRDRGLKLNVKLLVNNFIIFYNVFEQDAATRMLEMRFQPEYHPAINAVLTFLEIPIIGTSGIDRQLHEEIKQTIETTVMDFTRRDVV